MWFKSNLWPFDLQKNITFERKDLHKWYSSKIVHIYIVLAQCEQVLPMINRDFFRKTSSCNSGYKLQKKKFSQHISRCAETSTTMHRNKWKKNQLVSIAFHLLLTMIGCFQNVLIHQWNVTKTIIVLQEKSRLVCEVWAFFVICYDQIFDNRERNSSPEI